MNPFDQRRYIKACPVAHASTRCRLGTNEISARAKDSDVDLATLAADAKDYKSLIASATDAAQKLALAQRLAKVPLTDSIGALSQQSPLRLIDTVMPRARSSFR
jgi:hypothetical protein